MAIDLKINDTVKTVTKGYVNKKQITSIYLGNQLIFPFRVTWRFLIGINTYTEVVELYQYEEIPSRALPPIIQTEEQAKMPTNWDDLSPITSDRVITCIYVDGIYATFTGVNCTSNLSDGFYMMGTEVTWTADEGYYFDTYPALSRVITRQVQAGENTQTATQATVYPINITVEDANRGYIVIQRTASPYGGGSIGIIYQSTVQSQIGSKVIAQVNVYEGDTLTAAAYSKGQEYIDSGWTPAVINKPEFRQSTGAASTGNFEVRNNNNFSVDFYYYKGQMSAVACDDNPVTAHFSISQYGLDFDTTYYCFARAQQTHTITLYEYTPNQYNYTGTSYVGGAVTANFDFDATEISSTSESRDIDSEKETCTTEPQDVYDWSFTVGTQGHASWNDSTAVEAPYGSTITISTIDDSNTQVLITKPDGTTITRIATGDAGGTGYYYKPTINIPVLWNTDLDIECYGVETPKPGYVYATFSGHNCSTTLQNGYYRTTDKVTWTADSGYFFIGNKWMGLTQTNTIHEGANTQEAVNTKPTYRITVIKSAEDTENNKAWGTVVLDRYSYDPTTSQHSNVKETLFTSTVDNPETGTHVLTVEEGDKLIVSYTPKPSDTTTTDWAPESIKDPVFVESIAAASTGNFKIRNTNSSSIACRGFYSLSSTGTGTAMNNGNTMPIGLYEQTGLAENTTYYVYFTTTQKRNRQTNTYSRVSSSYTGTSYVVGNSSNNYLDFKKTTTSVQETQSLSSPNRTQCRTVALERYTVTFAVDSSNHMIQWDNTSPITVPYGTTYSTQLSSDNQFRTITFKEANGTTITSRTATALNSTSYYWSYKAGAIEVTPNSIITTNSIATANSARKGSQKHLYAAKYEVQLSYNYSIKTMTFKVWRSKVKTEDTGETIPYFDPLILWGYQLTNSATKAWETSDAYGRGGRWYNSTGGTTGDPSEDTQPYTKTYTFTTSDYDSYSYIGYRFQWHDGWYPGIGYRFYGYPDGTYYKTTWKNDGNSAMQPYATLKPSNQSWTVNHTFVFYSKDPDESIKPD